MYCSVGLVALGSLFAIPVVRVALRVEASWAGKVSKYRLSAWVGNANATRQETRATQNEAQPVSATATIDNLEVSEWRGEARIITTKASRLPGSRPAGQSVLKYLVEQSSCLNSGEESQPTSVEGRLAVHRRTDRQTRRVNTSSKKSAEQKRARQDQAGLETTAQDSVACRMTARLVGQSGEVAMRTRREGAVRDQTWVTSNPREMQGSRGTQSRLDRGATQPKISISRLFQPMAGSYLFSDCLSSVSVRLSPLGLSALVRLPVCSGPSVSQFCLAGSLCVSFSFSLPKLWWVGVAPSPGPPFPNGPPSRIVNTVVSQSASPVACLIVCLRVCVGVCVSPSYPATRTRLWWAPSSHSPAQSRSDPGQVQSRWSNPIQAQPASPGSFLPVQFRKETPISLASSRLFLLAHSRSVWVSRFLRSLFFFQPSPSHDPEGEQTDAETLLLLVSQVFSILYTTFYPNQCRPARPHRTAPRTTSYLTASSANPRSSPCLDPSVRWTLAPRLGLLLPISVPLRVPHSLLFCACVRPLLHLQRAPTDCRPNPQRAGPPASLISPPSTGRVLVTVGLVSVHPTPTELLEATAPGPSCPHPRPGLGKVQSCPCQLVLLLFRPVLSHNQGLSYPLLWHTTPRHATPLHLKTSWLDAVQPASRPPSLQLRGPEVPMMVHRNSSPSN